MTAYTARFLSTNRLQQSVHQVAHGFVVGDVVNFDGGVPPWELAKADNILDSQGCMMVSFIIDTDNFVVTQTGHVLNITDPSIRPLNVGVQYYLSPTLAGAMTITRPSTAGQYILPCFVADTTTSGYFFGGTGQLITPPSEFIWNTVTVDTLMLPNNGYFVNSVGHINLTLPTSFVSGDKIEIAGVNGTNSWTVVQNNVPLQSILVGAQGATTPGAGGSLASTNSHDSIDLIGITPSTLFMVDNIEGNITVV